MKATEKSELLGLNIQEVTDLLQACGEPPYRARQLFRALYRQRISALGEALTLPRPLREKLEAEYAVGLPGIEKRFVSTDGTIRYLWRYGTENWWRRSGCPRAMAATPEDSENRQVALQVIPVHTPRYSIGPRFAFPVRWVVRLIVSSA